MLSSLEHDHILPWRPENWRPLFLTFRKTAPPILRHMAVLIPSASQSSQNDEFPLYDEPERRGGIRSGALSHRLVWVQSLTRS